jgi:excisionase family DNA binding protein
MALTNHKEVLTTGEVAKICHVAPRTVSKWFDSGKLRGYRIPGSRDRRIPLAQLVAFMRAHGIPLEGLDGGTCRVLIVAADVSPAVVEDLDATNRYTVETAANGFEAGVVIQQFRPQAVVLDFEDRAEAVAICRNIRSSADFEGIRIILACNEPEGAWSDELARAGFDGCVARPLQSEQLAAAIEQVTDLVG